MMRFKTTLLAACTLLLMALATACSDAQSQAPSLDPVSGNHPAGWAQTHWEAYTKDPAKCRTCHGSTTDPAQAGGISKVSCFKCHASPDHPTGWVAGLQHGRLGAQAQPSDFAGFSNCATCHGSDYRQGLGTATSCFTCHTKAPHPDRPWLGGNAGVSSHAFTHEDNAAACAACHLNGANSTRVPATPPAIGAQPGCYNNTLCHDRNLGGPVAGSLAEGGR